LEYFMAIWHNAWQFGIVCGRLVYFSHFGMFGPRKIWQPCSWAEDKGGPYRRSQFTFSAQICWNTGVEGISRFRNSSNAKKINFKIRRNNCGSCSGARDLS
jgi:hypothetical protein